MKKKILILFILLGYSLWSQSKIVGLVTDMDTTVPIAFAKVSHENQVVYTNWEGKFELQNILLLKPIKVTYKGYHDSVSYLNVGQQNLHVKMVALLDQKDAEIFSENKVNSIIKKVEENKKSNLPEEVFPYFSYKNYEFLHVSANPDSIDVTIDTIVKKRIFKKSKIAVDSSNFKFRKIIEKRHLYQTEKINLIENNLGNNKETILATRMAGFVNPVYEFLGLELVSYSIYENPFDILEMSVHNPLSKYGRKLYTFKLLDSITIDNRTVYQIYFQPKKIKSNRVRGLIYIDAENFGVAKAFYRIYGVVKIEATYEFFFDKSSKIWIPKKRKFIVKKGTNADDIKIFGETIKFKSTLDSDVKKDATDQIYLSLESVPYDFSIKPNQSFKKKGIQIEVPKAGLNQPEAYWQNTKKDTLDARKILTYQSLDSIAEAEKIEHKVFLGKKIINGYLPINQFDLDLRSIIKYNNFEGFRFGFGGVTNSKWTSTYKIAFYAAYGLKDENFKFSIEPSYLLNKNAATWIGLNYTDDLSEIAQTTFATDTGRFKIYDPRPFNISTFYHHQSFSAKIASQFLPKTDWYAEIKHSSIEPLFDYQFVKSNTIMTNYELATAQICVLWSPFSKFMQTPDERLEYKKNHPKFTFQFTQAIPEILKSDFTFSKIDFKTHYELPFLSGHKSSILVQAGLVLGTAPLTHLYSIVPNNLNRDALLRRITFSSRNSFETMFFNEFFSDKFISLQLKHTFNKVRLGYKLNPEFTIVTRMAIGTMNHKASHQGLAFKTLEQGYFESGVECNKIFKGFGFVIFYRYGPYQFTKIEDNLALKLSFNLDLGF